MSKSEDDFANIKHLQSVPNLMLPSQTAHSYKQCALIMGRHSMFPNLAFPLPLKLTSLVHYL